MYFRKKKETKCYCNCSPRLYYASFFLVCGCQISRVQILESELRCYMNTLSALCFAYFKQYGNHAHTLAPHCGSATNDDLKTPTNELEFSDLNESVTQPEILS